MFLNSFYIQKSKLMLYPLLQFDKKSIRPKQTYLVYKNDVTLDNPAIVCKYERVDKGYYEFRNKEVFLNKNFLLHLKGIDYDYVVFTLKDYAKDYQHFLDGEYSKFSPKTKEIILEGYNNTTIGPILIDTHLNPEKYHEIFADDLMSDVETIAEVYETLSPPDFEKETV
jgi:hypothetical protein